MSAIGMAVLLLGLVGLFGVSALRRGKLLLVGAPVWEERTDRLAERLARVWTFAILQKKMRYYPLAGLAHFAIFAGFGVLLLRTLVLWGRGFDPAFNLWILGPESALGQLYGWVKDVFALLVLAGVTVFVYYRVIRPQKRMTLSGEGLVILGIIATMMLADMSYDGAGLVINARYGEFCGPDAWAPLCDRARLIKAPFGAPQDLAFHPFGEPAASLIALALASADLDLLVPVATLGFWIHSSLVLVFLNILPYSKHFHIITAIPNVFLSDLTAPGRLRPMAETTELLLERVEKASEASDPEAARIGYSKIEHFTWKDLLDLYTCTECGRCTDNCPAAKTGKKLSPKQLSLDLRSELYSLQTDAAQASAGVVTGKAPLVPERIDPDVLWACTTCRACEEQCPVGITYVDKIVQMRRNLVMMRGEFPTQLAKPFEGMETNGNPWNLSRLDRASWTEGLPIKRMADHPTAPVLYWVGCAVSYDDRAKKIARATAELFLTAGVDFAILAEEESCTGDPARRAGNEYLFSMLAEANVETLRGYQEKGGVRTIVTTCPHCFNTLKNEYPDFGARFEVVHHTDFLLGLLAEKRLLPKNEVKGKVAYHDSCYLGRYNGIYDAPRDILRAIEGLEVVEVDGASRQKGLCCGAGGAQMFMEEQNSDRVNVARTKQLLATGAETLAVACPFCMTMVSDGVKAEGREEQVRTLDVVEVLHRACSVQSH
jgi:Fe-S oxidoreductase